MKDIKLSDVLYACGAGVSSFYVNSVGILSPCVMTQHVAFDLGRGPFADGWENTLPKIKEKKIPLDFACKKCENNSLCGYCPGFFRLETGSDTKVSPYLCKIGYRMAVELNGDIETGDENNGREQKASTATLSKTGDEGNRAGC